jgi:LysM repeat protein
MDQVRNRNRRHGILRILIAITMVVVSLSERVVFARTESEAIIHVVAWGETVSSIAAKYGVTAADVISLNQLSDSNKIYVGQQLIIPFAPSSTFASQEGRLHIVQAGETLYRISLKYGVSVRVLMSINGLAHEDRIFIGQRLIIRPSGDTAISENTGTSDVGLPNYHIVQRGETLSGISQKYQVSMSALQTANGLLNPSLIFVGQRLTIPGAANAVSPGYTPEQATTTHIVRQGENLSAIAAQYGVSMWVIAQSNNMSNPSVIYPGQILSIPNSEALTRVDNAGVSLAKSVVVDVSEQRTYVFENGVISQVFVVSTGVPGQDTMRGNFSVQNRIPMAYAATWDLQMPYWIGFYWAGPLQNGFHALPILSDGSRLWGGLLGRPASYGCVILSEEDAQWLYGWVDIGTPVVVQD